MKIGDIVSRKSYGGDILFRINKIDDLGNVELLGIEYRLKTTANRDDLEKINEVNLVEYGRDYNKNIDKKINRIITERYINEDYSRVVGSVLHIDADEYYLDLCMKYYEKLNIPAHGEFVVEENQPKVVTDLLEKYKPDILVVTGHDSLKKGGNKDDINSYSNSKYFIETVRTARDTNYSRDSLVIIAGACQSYYEALIKAGANISSSPKRIVIHALDPFFCAEKIAYGNISHVLSSDKIISNTVSGSGGMGGIETRGFLRSIYPKV